MLNRRTGKSTTTSEEPKRFFVLPTPPQSDDYGEDQSELNAYINTWNQKYLVTDEQKDFYSKTVETLAQVAAK